MNAPPRLAIRIRRGLANTVVWQEVLGLLCFFVAWQLLRRIGLLTVMPGPLEIISGIPRQISQEGYALSWLASSQRVFLGFGMAAVLALMLGILIGAARRLRALTFPIFEILRSMPPLAWLPLSLLLWPTAETAMVFLAFIGAFFPVFIYVLSGLDNIDARYVQAAMSLGASKRTLLTRILIPGALPSVFIGLTISMAITWEVVIAAEMVSANNGLGYLTWNAYMSQSMVGIMVGMLSIGFASLMSSALVKALGCRFMPWCRSQRRRATTRALPPGQD